MGHYAKPRSWTSFFFGRFFPPPERRLVKAARLGAGNRILALLDKHGSDDVNVNYVDLQEREKNAMWRSGSLHWRKLRSPLYWCCVNDCSTGAVILMSRGANPLQRAADMSTPLHAAAGSLLTKHCLKIMLRASNEEKPGALTHLVDGQGRTPLHCAAVVGRVEVMELLVAHDVPLNAQETPGSTTALHVAVANDHPDFVAALLESGADPNVQRLPDLATPLLLVLLKACGEEPGLANQVKLIALHLIRHKPLELEASLADSRRALHMCLQIKGADPCNDLLDALLSSGADANALYNDQTPLMVALQHQTRNLPATKRLLASSANANLTDDAGATVIAMVIEGHHAELLCVYLADAQDLDINLLVHDGTYLLLAIALATNTAMHAVAEKMALSILELPATDTDLCDSYETSPVLAAVAHGTLAVLKRLLERQASVDLPDRDGTIALFYACQHLDHAGGGQSRTGLPIPDGPSAQRAATLLAERSGSVFSQDKDGHTPLHRACRHAMPDLIDILLKRKVDVNVADRDGLAALHVAVDVGFLHGIAAVGALADVNQHQANSMKRTALMQAAAAGNMTVMGALLALGSKRISFGVTDAAGNHALHLCMRLLPTAEHIPSDLIGAQDSRDETAHAGRPAPAGPVSVALALIGHTTAADLDRLDSDGIPPVWRATVSGNASALDALVGHGASVDVLVELNDDGTFCDSTASGASLTPILFAARYGLPLQLTTTLIQSMTKDVDLADGHGKTALHYFVEQRRAMALAELLANTPSPDVHLPFFETGESPAFVSIQLNDSACLHLLLRHGASLDDARPSDGLTPLLYAVHHDCSFNLVRVIVEYTTTGIDARDAEGNTALLLAAGRKMWTVVNEIADATPPPDFDIQHPATGHTATHMALAADEGAVLRKMVERGASLELVNTDGRTPLLSALYSNKSDETTIFLISMTKNIDSEDDDGRTALLLACKENRPNIAKACLSHGAALDVRDKRERSPVDYTIENDASELLLVLVEHGASVDVGCNGYDTLLLCALDQRKSAGLLSVLLKHTQDNLNARFAGNTAAHLLALRNDAANLQVLLRRGADGNAVDDSGRTILHIAVQQNNVACLNVAALNVDLEVEGWRPPAVPAPCRALYYAAVLGDYDSEARCALVLPLVDAGADCNWAPEGSATVLYNCIVEQQDEDLLAVILRQAPANAPKLDLNQADVRSGETALGAAARLGLTKMVSMLLSAGASAEVATASRTALIAAIQNGHFEIARSLLPLSTLVLKATEPLADNSALHLLVMKREISLVTELLRVPRDRLDIDQTNGYGETALAVAARLNTEGIVRQLLDSGASADTMATDGMTPLLSALALHGQVELARSLAAQTRRHIDAETTEGKTAVFLASSLGSLDLLSALKEAGASLSAGKLHPIFPVIQRGLIAAALFIAKHADAESLADTDQSNRTALLLACEQGATSLVDKLIQRSPSTLNFRSDAGDLPIGVAAIKGHIGCLKFLVSAGAHCNVQDSSGRTPMHLIACRAVDPLMVAALTRAAPETLNVPDANGLKPLLLAYNPDSPDRQARLVRSMLRFSDGSLQLNDSIPSTGMTPLFQAVLSGSTQAVRQLLHYGADPNVTLAKCSSTPLLLAARLNNRDVVHIAQELLLADADADAVDVAGCTALYYAVVNSNVSLLQVLLDSGCNVDQRVAGYTMLAFLLLKSCMDGMTGDSNAGSNNRQKMIDMLIRSAASPFTSLSGKQSLIEVLRPLETTVVAQEPVWMDSLQRYEARYTEMTGALTEMLEQAKENMGAATQRRVLNRDQFKVRQLEWKTQPRLDELHNTHTMNFDTFISYRVQLEGAKGSRLAQNLALALSVQPRSKEAGAGGDRLRVWLDLQQLKAGVDWERGFLDGLRNSATFMPLISDALLDQLKELQEGARDNVLREWDMALDLHDSLNEEDIGNSSGRHCPQFLPLAVGRTSLTVDGHEVSVPFNHAQHPLSSFPDVVMAHNFETAHRRTVRDTVARMKQLQWTSVSPTGDQGDFTVVATAIATQYYKCDFSGDSVRVDKYLAAAEEDAATSPAEIDSHVRMVLTQAHQAPPATPGWSNQLRDYIASGKGHREQIIRQLEMEANNKTKLKQQREQEKLEKEQAEARKIVALQRRLSSAEAAMRQEDEEFGF